MEVRKKIKRDGWRSVRLISLFLRCENCGGRVELGISTQWGKFRPTNPKRYTTSLPHCTFPNVQASIDTLYFHSAIWNNSRFSHDSTHPPNSPSQLDTAKPLFEDRTGVTKFKMVCFIIYIIIAFLHEVTRIFKCDGLASCVLRLLLCARKQFANNYSSTLVGRRREQRTRSPRGG